MRWTVGISLFLTLFVCTLYASSLYGQFVFDDLTIINILRANHISTFTDVLKAGYGFRPLLTKSYAFDWWRSSNPLDPFNYHVTNVLLHALNTILVFLIIERLSNKRDLAIVGALLFASHPLLSSAVASISSRSSVLCATFYFAAILCTLHHRWMWSIPCVILACLVKEEAITLLLLLPALAYLTDGRLNRYIFVALVFIYAALAITLYPYYTQLARVLKTSTELTQVGFEPAVAQPIYFYTYLAAVATYAVPLMIVPIGLNVDPSIPVISTWSDWSFICAIALLLTALLQFFLSRNHLLIRLGLVLLVISPLTAYAFMPVADPMLEHRLYIPLLGMILIAIHFFDRYTRLTPLTYLAVFALLLTFSFYVQVRNHVWSTPVRLWTDTVAKSPLKARAHLNLGSAYSDLGSSHYDLAISEFELALRLNPRLYAAQANIAAVYINRGQYDQAEYILTQIITAHPTFAAGWYNLSLIYSYRGDSDKAALYRQRATEISTLVLSGAKH